MTPFKASTNPSVLPRPDSRQRTRRVGRSTRLGLLLAISLCIAFLAAFSVSYASLLSRGEAGPKQTDFVPYYTAGKLVAIGSGAHIYDRAIVGRYERQLVRPLHVKDGVMPFLYPPFFALATAPLAMLPYTAADILWLLLNLVLLAGALLLLHRYLGAVGPAAVLLWVGALSFLPVLLSLAQGQVSLLILALLGAAFVALRSDHEYLAGVLLAPALIKPPYVVPLLLILLIQWRWRTMASFALTTLGLFGASALMLGAGSVSAFVHTMMDAAGWSSQIGGFEPRFNDSFAGIAQLALPAHWASLVTVILDVVVIVTLIWAAWTSRLEHAYAIAVVVGLLIGPHVLLHDLSLLLIPAVISIRDGMPDTRLASLLAAGYAAVVAGLALVGPLHTQLSVFAMVALLAWLLFSVRRAVGIPTMPMAITSLLPEHAYPNFAARTTRAHR